MGRVEFEKMSKYARKLERRRKGVMAAIALIETGFVESPNPSADPKISDHAKNQANEINRLRAKIANLESRNPAMQRQREMQALIENQRNHITLLLDRIKELQSQSKEKELVKHLNGCKEKLRRQGELIEGMAEKITQQRITIKEHMETISKLQEQLNN